MNKYIPPLYNRLDITFIKGKKLYLFDEKKRLYRFYFGWSKQFRLKNKK